MPENNTLPPSFNELHNILLGINGGGNPSGVKINSNTQAGSVQYGQTTLDKVLNTILSGFALYKNASYVPTTTQPANQNYGGGYNPNDLAYQQLLAQQYATQNAGGQFGASLQRFFTENSTVVLIGGVALVLYMSGRK